MTFPFMVPFKFPVSPGSARYLFLCLKNNSKKNFLMSIFLSVPCNICFYLLIDTV